jgi:hypothetical protein
MTRSPQFEAVKRQAVAIATQEAQRRKKEAENRPPTTTLKFMRASDFTGPIPPRKQPLRAWAELAAPLITEDEWQEIVWHCHDRLPAFDGDMIRFFENAFEGLHLKDGCLVVP